MSYSTQRAVSLDGMLALLDIEIEYFGREEISVYFNSVQDAHPWNWVGTSEHQIAFSPPVPIGVEVLVKRSTDISQPRHVFSQGAAFEEAVLDEVLLQTLHIAQEARENATIEEVFTNLNMHGYRMTNVGDPVDDLDAVNKRSFTSHDAQILVYRGQCEAARDAAAESAAEAADSAASVNAANLAHVNGDNAIGTWGINISGNAATASIASEATHAVNSTAANHALTADSAATAVTVDVGGVNASNKIANGIITPQHLVQVPGEATANVAGTASAEVTGIPTWVTEITVVFRAVTPSIANRLKVQIGSGVYVTSSYFGGAGSNNGDAALTSGFALTDGNTAAAYSGVMRIVRVSNSSTYWAATANGVTSNVLCVGAGDVDAGGTLDRVKVSFVGAGTFTSGTVTIKYR